MHVSFDYKQIANDITEYILHKSYRNVAVFVDSVRFSETFVLTIMQNLEKAGVGITIYGSTNRNAIVRASASSRDSPSRRAKRMHTSESDRECTSNRGSSRTNASNSAARSIDSRMNDPSPLRP